MKVFHILSENSAPIDLSTVGYCTDMELCDEIYEETLPLTLLYSLHRGCEFYINLFLGKMAEWRRSFNEYSELRPPILTKTVSVCESKMQINNETEVPDNRYCLRISSANIFSERMDVFMQCSAQFSGGPLRLIEQACI